MAKRFYELQKNITDLYDKIRKDEALMHRDITDLHYLRQISISNHGIMLRLNGRIEKMDKHRCELYDNIVVNTHHMAALIESLRNTCQFIQENEDIELVLGSDYEDTLERYGYEWLDDKRFFKISDKTNDEKFVEWKKGILACVKACEILLEGVESYKI